MSLGWDKIVDAIKLSPKYLFPISLTAAALLFCPAQFLKIIGMEYFVIEFRKWIGVVFLLSFMILLSHTMFWIYNEKYLWYRFILNGKKRLQQLTPEEKRILAMYILQNTRSRKFGLQSGVINGLEQEGIIYRASSVGDIISGFAYNIQPWAWKYLKKNPDLLK